MRACLYWSRPAKQLQNQLSADTLDLQLQQEILMVFLGVLQQMEHIEIETHQVLELGIALLINPTPFSKTLMWITAQTSPLTKYGATVRCSKLHGPSTVLLGDAAHGVTPQMGQGCNSALESAAIFCQVNVHNLPPSVSVHSVTAW